jgi:hypothetical protein
MQVRFGLALGCTQNAPSRLGSHKNTAPGAASLSLKVRLRDDKLARTLASATGAGELAVLPFVIELTLTN